MSNDLDIFFGNLDPVQKRAVDSTDDRLYRAIVLTRLNELNGRVSKNESDIFDHHTQLVTVRNNQGPLAILSAAISAVVIWIGTLLK